MSGTYIKLMPSCVCLALSLILGYGYWEEEPPMDTSDVTCRGTINNGAPPCITTHSASHLLRA
ncbi:hypothetical protein FKM82_008311 [Ascaphus truei]